MSSRRPSDLAELSGIALAVAEEAAALVLAGFRARPRVEEKAPHDLVTEFDRASEELLVARLGALTPGVPVVGEEESASRPTSAREGLVWCVDPLDGTTNFVHGHPFWCVSVGLMEDDTPVAGAVVAPALGLRWTGQRPRDPAPPEAAGHARRNGEPCAVSATASLHHAMIATGFPTTRDRAPDNNFDAFITVKRRAQAVRRCGSAAIDLCMVADGTYDAYWERRLHVWDVAAGSAIVRGAGGVITALEGGPPNYHIGHIVASNGLIHASIVALFSDRA
ncbi:inositol monophosphatase [Sorangium cellulosum]|uniref:Inositol-1-monophosphatase n=1 Tax=Sorangium cellulosum TaxID=56 RepID=A0A2L0F7P7_SORCE|nr:inositol monophosphatase family protein [Sorangium cellulosum]AUX47449.1 inositol monophosphatase [Sorangium cellulosum]